MNNKPFVLGVDCDGVLADYFGGFRNYVADAMRVPRVLLPIPIAYDFSSDPAWSTVMPDRDIFLRWHNKAVSAGIFRELAPMRGASEALWNLSNAGVYVRIITHRFHQHGSYSRVVADTVHWLDCHDIPYRGLAFERWKSDVNCDLYVDDSPSNVLELRASGNDCIVFDAPYNQDVPGLRAKGWDEALRIIQQRIVERAV